MSIASRLSLYDSIEEVRYYCRNGGHTIEGSTPISEQPNLKPEQQGLMFALKSKEGCGGRMYISKHEEEYCFAHEVDNIHWIRNYLEAEEMCSRTSLTAVDSLVVFKEAIEQKDIMIRQLRDDNERLKEKLDRMIIRPYQDSDPEHWGIKPEHSNETDQN